MGYHFISGYTAKVWDDVFGDSSLLYFHDLSPFKV